eukprot:9468688-Pyramimonas_sp.AAC.2
MSATTSRARGICSISSSCSGQNLALCWRPAPATWRGCPSLTAQRRVFWRSRTSAHSRAAAAPLTKALVAQSVHSCA